MANEILTLAKYPDTCSDCNRKVEKGDMIRFNTFHKSVRHVKCDVKKDEEEGKNE